MKALIIFMFFAAVVAGLIWAGKRFMDFINGDEDVLK